MVEASKPTVLIIDDSASSRAALAEVLEAHGCDVVGRAMDGRLGLRLALELEPDVITVDLEMPHMDGFTFLRILAHQKPIPVVVVTSDARPESALQALELGARDFVVKPGHGVRDFNHVGAVLAPRIHALSAGRGRPAVFDDGPDFALPSDVQVVVIGASTGGPRALRDITSRFPSNPRAPVVIAQHMPPRFTKAFAERLARFSGHDVQEGKDGERLVPGMVRVIPGASHGRLRNENGRVILAVEPADECDRLVPSVDRLLLSAASEFGAHALAIILTGMGRDGAIGAQQFSRVGAPLWAESALTAVVDGMPAAAAEAHRESIRLPLDLVAHHLSRVLAGDDGAMVARGT